MQSELDLIKIRDEVFRKIGRNLLNFQKIELMLKHIITNGRMSGYISEIKANQEQRSAAVHKQTMGNLVGQFVENTLLGHEESSQAPIDLKEPYFSFSFTVNADADFFNSKRQSLKLLVDDRNDLIHHLLPRFNDNSIESCLETERYLDQQRERLIPEYEHLKELIESLEEGKKVHAEFLSSEEGIKQFELSFLQQSPIVALLLNIAIQKARKDGWALLSVAGQQIRLILPEEIGQLKNNWGYKTLKEVMVASEFFDIIEESTEKGGVRVLYRPKPHLAYCAYTRLVQSLLDTANKTVREDGWVLLSTALSQIEQSLTEEFALVKEKYGHESLKALLLDSELFDITEKSNDKNNIQVVFRPKIELISR